MVRALLESVAVSWLDRASWAGSFKILLGCEPEFTDRSWQGTRRLALFKKPRQEPTQPVLASVEASTITISVLVGHSREFVDRELYLEFIPDLYGRSRQTETVARVQ